MLSLARLIAELYNFTLLSSNVIFGLLFHLLNFGHQIPTSEVPASVSSAASDVRAQAAHYAIEALTYDPRVYSDLDIPEDCFRAQVTLFCDILRRGRCLKDTPKLF